MGHDGFLSGYCSSDGVCGLDKIFVAMTILGRLESMWGGRRLTDASEKREKRDDVEYQISNVSGICQLLMEYSFR